MGYQHDEKWMDRTRIQLHFSLWTAAWNQALTSASERREEDPSYSEGASKTHLSGWERATDGSSLARANILLERETKREPFYGATLEEEEELRLAEGALLWGLVLSRAAGIVVGHCVRGWGECAR